MTNKALVNLDNIQAEIVASVFESLNQVQIDLAKLCAMVCANEAQSANTFSELLRIQRNIDSVCNLLEAPPADSPFFEMYEECDLADSFLSCLVLKVWSAETPPKQQPLDWCDAVVIYGVVFSAMHRVENALKAFEEMTV